MESTSVLDQVMGCRVSPCHSSPPLGLVTVIEAELKIVKTVSLMSDLELSEMSLMRMSACAVGFAGTFHKYEFGVSATMAIVVQLDPLFVENEISRLSVHCQFQEI